MQKNLIVFFVELHKGNGEPESDNVKYEQYFLRAKNKNKKLQDYSII